MDFFKRIFSINNDYNQSSCLKRKIFALFGLKLFSIKVNKIIKGVNNKISAPDEIFIRIEGANNRIDIANDINFNFLKIQIIGNNNYIQIDNIKNIEANFTILGNNHKVIINKSKYPINCKVSIGQITDNNIKTSDNTLIIKNNCHIVGADFYLYQNETSVIIGDDCLLSDNITIQSNDGHIIYDKITNKVLNNDTYKVEIGSHVWIGRRAYIYKKAKIPSGCIVGANSLVTKAFEKENCIIAGTPAKIIKENINWERDFLAI